MTTIERMLEIYLKLGLNPIPLKGKLPLVKWKDYHYNPQDFDKSGVNVGLRTGLTRNNKFLFVVDLDDKELLSPFLEVNSIPENTPIIVDGASKNSIKSFTKSGDNCAHDTFHWEDIYNGVKEGFRHNVLLRYLGILYKMGETINGAITLAGSWNNLNTPPLEEEELIKTIEDFASVEEEDFYKAWDTESDWTPNVHTMSLKDLIFKIGYPSSTSNNEGRYPIGVFPKGLKLCMDEIADTRRNLTLAKIERISTCHGLAIIVHDPIYKEICTFHRILRQKVWDLDDFELSDELEVKSDSYKFARDAPSSNSSIGILHNRDGLSSRMSRRIGLTLPKLYMCLIIESVMTWPNARWRKKLNEEHDRFITHIKDKQAKLKKYMEQYGLI